MSCTPEQLSYIHQKHENPTTLVKKVMREFDRGTRGWFLRKVVLGHGGGGTFLTELGADAQNQSHRWSTGAEVATTSP